MIEFFNYFDRQVVFPLFSYLKEEFSLSDFQLGLTGTVFMIVHATASIPLGILADKWIRKKIIAIGVFLWSFATFLTGFAQNFTQLLIARGTVGIGEASYAPAATSLIAENYPPEKRAKASSIFHLGMFFGGTLGMMLAGIIGTHLGWRACFFIVAVPGIILAWFALRIRETEHKHRNTENVNYSNILKLFRNPIYILTLISGIMLTFTSSAIISWMTQFFIRYHGYMVSEASVIIGITVIAGGPPGIFCGGYISDMLLQRFQIPRSLSMGVAFLIATPLLWITLTTQHKTVLIISLISAAFFMTWYYGPMVAFIQDIVPPFLRATAFAFYLFIVHLIGSTPAPAIIGKISDITNLQTACYFIVLSNFLGAFFLSITTLIIYRKRKVSLQSI